MKKINFARAALAALVINISGGCYSTCRCTANEPSLSNLKKWKGYLKVREAEPDEQIGTTQTQISNVSPNMAAAKIAQALEAYDAKLGYRLTTVFQIANTDKDEGEDGKPAITGVVVGGHYYYIAMLDLPSNKSNRAAYESTKGKIPALAVVNAEDETKPAWIRTETAGEKPEPYGITLYLGEQALIDDSNIYRYLRNKGFGTVGCHRLDNPTLEVDDNWRPYFTVTYAYDDGCGELGTAYYGDKLLVVDAQTKEIKSYTLDNPNTPNKDERAADIPEWVDQVYSPRLIKDWITYWGYNPDNYGKTSDLDRFVVDAMDQVLNATNTNLVYSAYITSALPDNSMVGVMLVNPRTAEATFYPTQGSSHSMAVKSAAYNTIKQATVLYGYEVEDLTLHTIYGERTWEGVLTRPAFDNNKKPYGTLYAGTVLLKADFDLKPANVVWANTMHETFLRYERQLVTGNTRRVGSNVLEEKEISGYVDSIQAFTIAGNTSFVVRLMDHPDEFWEIQISYLGDPRTVDVFVTKPGDMAFIKYSDPKNRKHFYVREFTRVKN